MSRWIEQFESHAFQNTWSALKKSLEESKVDDETVVTSVKELARLNKVIKYLDEMINGIDPELIPPGTWDNFNAQSASCVEQINNYNSNRDIAHITKANAHADNLLTYVRPYMVVEGKVGQALQGSIKAYSKTIDEYVVSFQEKAANLLTDIGDHKTRSEEVFGSIETVKKQVDDINVELFGDEGVQTKIRGLAEEVDEKYGKINEFYKETLIGDENEISTKKALSQAEDVILAEQNKIEELLESVTKEVKELEKFHSKIFGELNEKDERAGGLSGDLDKRIEELSGFEVEQKKKYKALNEEIETLLPGATSTGLATAYRDMKGSFDAPIKHASKVYYWSLGLLVFASALLAIDSIGGENWISFVKFETWAVVLRGLAYKTPFYAPVLWLAFYATKRRSEYQRLQQEYAHKEALAKSYGNPPIFS